MWCRPRIHPDPVGEIADRAGFGVSAAVVAYVLGTRGDPQDLDAQRRTLCEAGAIVTQTSAQAARVAAAIAGRRPDLATASP
jgi:hypothetical protein